MNSKKQSQDYKIEYVNLQIQLEKLQNEIRNRLLGLSKIYPDAIVSIIGDIPIKAKSISNINYLKMIDIPTCILYIQNIEEWIAKQYPVQQKIIEFPNQ